MLIPEIQHAGVPGFIEFAAFEGGGGGGAGGPEVPAEGGGLDKIVVI